TGRCDHFQRIGPYGFEWPVRLGAIVGHREESREVMWASRPRLSPASPGRLAPPFEKKKGPRPRRPYPFILSSRRLARPVRLETTDPQSSAALISGNRNRLRTSIRGFPEEIPLLRRNGNLEFG